MSCVKRIKNIRVLLFLYIHTSISFFFVLVYKNVILRMFTFVAKGEWSFSICSETSRHLSLLFLRQIFRNRHSPNLQIVGRQIWQDPGLRRCFRNILFAVEWKPSAAGFVFDRTLCHLNAPSNRLLTWALERTSNLPVRLLKFSKSFRRTVPRSEANKRIAWHAVARNRGHSFSERTRNNLFTKTIATDY